jgi:alanyl-tRNA synthetase
MATRRLYYEDSFEREFSAQIVSCDTALRGSNPVWEVVLDSTAFYPTSGGQPHDLGRLDEACVLDVRDENEEIVHVIDRPLERGAVRGCIDWTRRFAHMQQHSGQHLLSAIFQERFGRPTVSFHLGGEISTVDLHGPEPSEEVLEGAERAANQSIFEDRPVTVRYGTAQELARLGVRKEVDRAGMLRAIEIEGIDLQPCGGTHVQHTAQIGMMLVRRCAKIRQDWRVEFVCGGRAERAARRDFVLLRRAAERLSCAADDVATAAERVVTERDAHFKSARAAVQRLAEAEAALEWQATAPGPEGVLVIARVFQDDTQPEYLSYFATQLAKSENTIALLARSPCGLLVFAQHPSAGKDMNALLKRVLDQIGGKGGGTRDFARGRVNDEPQAEVAVSIAKELLSAA